jgi:hypothetical protein
MAVHLPHVAEEGPDERIAGRDPGHVGDERSPFPGRPLAADEHGLCMRLVGDEDGELLLQPDDVPAGQGEQVFEPGRRRRSRGRDGGKEGEGEEGARHQRPVVRVLSMDILGEWLRVTGAV